MLLFIEFIFFIFLPDKILLGFVPDSLGNASFDMIFVYNHVVDLIVFNSWQIIELSSNSWILLATNKLI